MNYNYQPFSTFYKYIKIFCTYSTNFFFLVLFLWLSLNRFYSSFIKRWCRCLMVLLGDLKTRRKSNDQTNCCWTFVWNWQLSHIHLAGVHISSTLTVSASEAAAAAAAVAAVFLTIAMTTSRSPLKLRDKEYWRGWRYKQNREVEKQRKIN